MTQNRTPNTEYRIPNTKDSAISKSRLQVTAILLIGAFLRLFGLVTLSPPGVAHDEVANWLISRGVLAGNHAVYFTRAYGHEAGFHYVQAGFIHLLGDNLLALRLPAAFGGLLVVAVTYAFVRRLFGPDVALWSAALGATVLYPVFYGRLALRAIWLPLLSGLSAIFWTQAERPNLKSKIVNLKLVAAGLFAGLSLYTYLAARALPIFYLTYLVYLALTHRTWLKKQWRGIVGFWLTYAFTALPLVLFLLSTPNAEARVAEVSFPLRALLDGDVLPVLQNSWAILLSFGWAGALLWRENVAELPIFDPLLAILFYAGVLLCLWRWKARNHTFVLLWTLISTIPSIVTINAPSYIRIVNILLTFSIFPALVIHNLTRLSTVIPNLSTRKRQISTVVLLAIFALHASRTVTNILTVWPEHEEVEFVWQTAFAETAVILNNNPQIEQTAVGGWSADTFDQPTLELTTSRPVQTSHFGWVPGEPDLKTLIIPASAETAHIFRPLALPLSPALEQRLTDWQATQTHHEHVMQYTLPAIPELSPTVVSDVHFGDELTLLGIDGCDTHLENCTLTSYWRVEKTPAAAQRAFVQLLDNEGNVVAEDYRWDTLDPQELWFPHWHAGDIIIQQHPLPPEPTATQLRIGVFDPYSCDPCVNLGVTVIELP